MSKILFPIVLLLLFAAIEYYAYSAIKLLFPSKKWLHILYIVFTVLLWGLMFSYRGLGLNKGDTKYMFIYIGAVFMSLIVAKIVLFLVMLGGDVVLFLQKIFSKETTAAVADAGVSRRAFIAKLAAGAAGIPFLTMIYGIVVNAYNYQIKKVSIRFPNLPKNFDGFKIVQLSDIHSGSFTRKEPLMEAVKMINELNADVVLFTGDIVNSESTEMLPYIDIFKQIKAKSGVFAVTGNHDYGDYVEWNSPSEKIANFDLLKNIHQQLGWKLLMNENHIVEKENEKIAILGVENWGRNLHFPKYGKLKEAYSGTAEIPFKVLMSHDPSHWDGEIRPDYPDIDLTLSGHTHGFQFGIETKLIKWSPSQWVYKQWAGLYQEGKQYIYVNRGFGFLGYPGRVGILPEITEITLQKG